MNPNVYLFLRKFLRISIQFQLQKSRWLQLWRNGKGRFPECLWKLLDFTFCYFLIFYRPWMIQSANSSSHRLRNYQNLTFWLSLRVFRKNQLDFSSECTWISWFLQSQKPVWWSLFQTTFSSLKPNSTIFSTKGFLRLQLLPFSSKRRNRRSNSFRVNLAQFLEFSFELGLERLQHYVLDCFRCSDHSVAESFEHLRFQQVNSNSISHWWC